MNDVPGLFTGSGMPMRFAKADGTMIDVYQAATQMTDESGQSFPFTVDTLLDRALGAEGYYGAFVANMHTDTADAAAARRRSSRRPSPAACRSSRRSRCSTGSTAGTDPASPASAGTAPICRSRSSLEPAANGLQTLLPATFNGHALTALTRNGTP